MADIDAIAAEAWAAIREARQIEPFGAGLTLDDAYAAAARLRALRGERVVGRKIGFTNRSIWPRYGVDRPILGDVTEATLLDAAGPVSLGPFCEPRIEPEIVLGLKAAPRAGMSAEAVAACVAWVAPGFEIVQSIYPGWRFDVADTIVAGGLHGRLVLGDRTEATPEALAGLPAVELTLLRDDAEVERGVGANALGGPLEALRHLAEVAGDDAPGAGEVVSTGTLTDAWPLRPGDRWTARFRGALDTALVLAFTA